MEDELQSEGKVVILPIIFDVRKILSMAKFFNDVEYSAP